MKSEFQRLVFSTAISLACAACLYPGVASADEHLLIVLDRTVSMEKASVPGKTRFEVAKERIHNFLDTVPSETRRYSFWTFGGDTYTPVYTFNQYKTKQNVKAAVDATTTSGDTPLAHTVCAAVDELMNFLPNESHTKRIFLATDGGENFTPETDQCYGFHSETVYPDLQASSWQWKVRNKACTGDANSPAMCGSPGMPTIIVDIDHLFDFIPLRADSALEPGEGPHRLTLSSSNDAAFFNGLATETKGVYVGITPSTPLSQALGLPGDANLNGCVNITDLSLVLTQFGRSVSPGTPTDFNHDLVVNIYDYDTVMQNYGRGCTSP